jgi:TIR domain
MPDVFISFSSKDEKLARFVQDHLMAGGVSVFLVPASLHPGEEWSPQILNALRGSNWVIFLASRAACASSWVQQELGAAIGMQKKLVPIVWDMAPSELPGWTAQHQPINLAGSSIDQLRTQLGAIAERIKSDRNVGYLVLGLLVAGLLVGANG